MNLFKLSIFSAAMTLAACGSNNGSGGSSDTPTKENKAPVVTVKSVTELKLADLKKDMQVATFTATDADKDKLTITLGEPKQGMLRIDGNNVLLTESGVAFIKSLNKNNFPFDVSAFDGKSTSFANGMIMVDRTKPLPKGVIFAEDFTSGELSQWTVIDKSGDKGWTVYNNQVGQANCYKSSAACDDWLVTPALDMAVLSQPSLSFMNRYQYGAKATEQLRVKVSTDFSDDVLKATWVDISDKLQWSQGDDKPVETTVDLSDYADKKVRIAFHYKTPVADASRWSIDNVRVGEFEQKPLEANITKPNVIVAGRAIAMSAAGKFGAGEYTYAWDFGDGNKATGASVNHTYKSTADYEVSVTVTDKDKNTVVAKTPVSIVAETAYTVAAKQGDLRVASFNIGLDRFKTANAMNTELEKGTDVQAKKIAEIMQRTNADVILLNEIDGNDGKKTLTTFMTKYLQVSQNGQAAVIYANTYMSDCNTGVASGKDYNSNGKTDDADDAYGFGHYPGQYCMAILSKLPMDMAKVRTFQKFLWKDMPGALKPVLGGKDYYSSDVWNTFRLSSKTHIDLPVMVAGKEVHILASHPTPPVFDGDEDRNGKRNFDEIRLWADYIDPAKGDYLYDDAGTKKASLVKDTRFVIMGDENASAVEGDAATANGVTAIDQLLKSSLINPMMREDVAGEMIPVSEGGQENAVDSKYSKYHTASWKMRADYVLPSAFGLEITQSGVFWPKIQDDLYYLVNTTDAKGVRSSDHRLVWMDLKITDTTATIPTQGK